MTFRRQHNSKKHKAPRASFQWIARRTYITHIAAICNNGHIMLVPAYKYGIAFKRKPRKPSIVECVNAGNEYLPVNAGTLSLSK